MPEEASVIFPEHDLSTEDNICNQALRKLPIKSDQVDIAHVIMEPDTETTLHYHKKSWEYYLILEGEGVMLLGGEVHDVSEGDFITIPPEVPHLLRNTDIYQLCFLVISVPPYSADDVYVVEH